MSLPDPEPGLVISYAYLWHDEDAVGRVEGRKDRPCVIILSVEREAGGAVRVVVAPITHSRPGIEERGVEIPPRVKQHLGLDPLPSWVVVEEVNEFMWPGFDLRPIAGAPERYAYGFLPPRLFAAVVAGLLDAWKRGKARRTSR